MLLGSFLARRMKNYRKCLLLKSSFSCKQINCFKIFSILPATVGCIWKKAAEHHQRTGKFFSSCSGVTQLIFAANEFQTWSFHPWVALLTKWGCCGEDLGNESSRHLKLPSDNGREKQILGLEFKLSAGCMGVLQPAINNLMKNYNF